MRHTEMLTKAKLGSLKRWIKPVASPGGTNPPSYFGGWGTRISSSRPGWATEGKCKTSLWNIATPPTHQLKTEGWGCCLGVESLQHGRDPRFNSHYYNKQPLSQLTKKRKKHRLPTLGKTDRRACVEWDAFCVPTFSKIHVIKTLVCRYWWEAEKPLRSKTNNQRTCMGLT